MARPLQEKKLDGQTRKTAALHTFWQSGIAVALAPAVAQALYALAEYIPGMAPENSPGAVAYAMVAAALATLASYIKSSVAK